MLQPRIIPCLLLKNKGLVKTTQFRDPTYIGDPINAVRIFNQKEVDELIFLDIVPCRENYKINSIKDNNDTFRFIKMISEECSMPLAFGGGIQSLDDIRVILSTGVEKVVINTHAFLNPDLIKKSSEIFGCQSIVVSMDVKKNHNGSYQVFTHGGIRSTEVSAVGYAKKMAAIGAGELFVNSIDLDGSRAGYDINLINQVASSVDIPVIACGGAGSISHLHEALHKGNASAVAAGSMFVFSGRKRGVLINYPSKEEKETIIGN